VCHPAGSVAVMTSHPEFGWAIVVLVVAVVLMVVVWTRRVDKKLSTASHLMYFGALVAMSILAVTAGAVAAAHDKNVAVAYAAVIVTGGTLTQVLLAASTREGGPLIGNHITVDVLVRRINDEGQPEEVTTPIPVRDDDVRESLHVVGWALVLVGAIGGIVGAFIG